MSDKVILYGEPRSPAVRAVLLTLAALDLPYEFRTVDLSKGEHKTAEYLRLNPQHTIPTLVDEGKAIWDSHAIMAYLVRKYGKDDTLYPKGFYERALVDQRLHYEDGVLFTTHLRGLIRPVFLGTITRAQFDEKLKALSEVYDTLDKFVTGQDYMAGDHLTIADLSIISTVSGLSIVAPISASIRPKLAAWFERMTKLPYYEEANGKAVKAATEMVKAKLAELS